MYEVNFFLNTIIISYDFQTQTTMLNTVFCCIKFYWNSSSNEERSNGTWWGTQCTAVVIGVELQSCKLN